MKKTMIIGVGGAGCNMANPFRREAKSASIKNAIYVFADHRQPDIDYFKWADDSTAILNLYNIDLYNDLPEDFLRMWKKFTSLPGWVVTPGPRGHLL